ncbi:MAG: hypothetical protein ACFFAN_07170, partial [Promethearchaeota archaeon]
NFAFEILTNFKDYKLTSEDFGSKKKSENFLLLSNNCFKTNNFVEGLSYLNKAIINQSECESIIENYLKKAIENNLYLEFFEFLKSGCENDLSSYFLQFNLYIEKGFKKFLNSALDYSFFNLLSIIESLNKIFEFIGFSFVRDLLNKLKKMVYSSNLKEKYFSIYFIKKNLEILINLNPFFKDLIDVKHFESFKDEILDYFFDEIDNLAIIDKLKLMKKQFEALEIPKERFYVRYKRYKEEIKELEKKVYLKKFSFLKLLMEKYNINITKGEFRKKRNTYIIKHDNENLKNPVYSYIISHLGFYGTESQVIKSSDIGVNYFIMKELFLDDLSSHPDILYYKEQFWGDEEEDFKINYIDGFSLLSENVNYKYDIDQKYSNIDDIIIIEWDLANKPRQGSIVNAYDSQIIIPDHNNSLFHDLKPFDLCYCNKTPIKIEGTIIKTINVITKCSFKDAINSICKGMAFVEGFYPLYLVKSVLCKEISPFKANEIAENNPNKLFVPKYSLFIKNFREFLFEFVKKEKDYIFEELKSDPKKKINQILTLLNLKNELAGLDLPYYNIMKNLFNQDLNLKQFKSKLLKKIHSFVKNVLERKEVGKTSIFDLKKMNHTPFFKYSDEIIKIRKEEFENSKVYEFNEKGEIWYNFLDISKTYYGLKILKILGLNEEAPIKKEQFRKFSKFASRLNLHLNLIKDNFNKSDNE